MSSFSYSNVAGYASHLPLKHVKLPLKYILADQPTDLNEQFRNKAFSFGGFIDLSSQSGNPFDSIQYGVTNDMKSVHLTPVLVDEATSLGFQFRSIIIHLPDCIISKGTATFQFVALTIDTEPYILVDLIDKNYLFITLKFELSDFFIGNPTNRLVLDNFNDWVNISVPYSFELRSVPFFMKALNPENVIVSLKDGGLLHFSRKNPLDTMDIFNFSESVPLMSFNFVGGLFKSSKEPEVLVNGISSNAVVDIVQISVLEFCSLTVSKTLKIWDFQLHRQSRSAIELEKDHRQSHTWLTTIPTKYLQIFQSGTTVLMSLFATSDNTAAKLSGYEFRTWEIPQSGNLIEAEQLSLVPELPNFKLPSAEANSTVFKIQDFSILSCVTPSGTLQLKYYILWKSNTYSIVSNYAQDVASGTITSSMWSHSYSDALLKELTPHHGSDYHLDYYLNTIFNSGKYDTEIVKTALSIFKNHSGYDIPALEALSLRKSVIHTIIGTSKAVGVSAQSLWYKLELICEEFKKLSQEPLALLVTPSFVLTAQVYGIGIYRPSHFYEIFLQSNDGSKLSKLLGLLVTKFSPNTYKRLAHEFEQMATIDGPTATNLASKYLCNKISDEEIRAIMEDLESITDVVEEIQQLIGNALNSDIVLGDITSLATGEGVGLFSKLLAIGTFKSIKTDHEIILLSLLILFLLCEVNESVLTFLNSILQRYSRYGIIEQVLDTCFFDSAANSSVEKRNVSKSENSIFWKAVVERNPDLTCLIKKKDYNFAYDYFCDIVVGNGYDDFIVNVILELVDRNEGDLIMEKFITKFDRNLPINKFLTGLIYWINNEAGKFFDIFIDYKTFDAVNNTDIRAKLLKSLTSNPVIKYFLSSIFSSAPNDSIVKSNYYHQLSELSRSQGINKASSLVDGVSEKTSVSSQKNFLSISLEFEKLAITTLEELNDSDTKITSLTGQYHRNLFGSALESQHYDEAIDSLYHLRSLLTMGEFKNLFHRFLKTLLSNHEMSRIFRATPSNLFVENFLLVDSILLEMANEDLILSNALKCYELLYSWRLFGCFSEINSERLGDKRGAAEALYIFITRFKLEQENLGLESNGSEDFTQFKLKILELFMIILNCLKTFEADDDKWLVKRDNSNNRSVIKVEELTLEYYRWLKELEHDLGD